MDNLTQQDSWLKHRERGFQLGYEKGRRDILDQLNKNYKRYIEKLEVVNETNTCD